jgi:hypothetical protein
MTHFVRMYFGDGYVNETLDNIKDGNPVAIYKSGSNWASFIGITLNNIKVGAYLFSRHFLLVLVVLFIS